MGKFKWFKSIGVSGRYTFGVNRSGAEFKVIDLGDMALVQKLATARLGPTWEMAGTFASAEQAITLMQLQPNREDDR